MGGNGEDNPHDPLILTPLQKNRAVTFEYSHIKEFQFTIGCSEGKTVRVFQFNVRPSLECAMTRLGKSTLIHAMDKDDPVVAVRTKNPDLKASEDSMRGHRKSNACSVRPILFTTLVVLASLK